MKPGLVIALALGLGGAAPLPIVAEDPAPADASTALSATTPIDFAECTIMASDDFGTVRACPGYKGIPVMLTESRRRFFISFGLEAPHEKAAEQSLPPYNIPGADITWRLESQAGVARPFAAIVPFTVAGADGRPYGDVLVVMKVAQGATCQIGYLDTIANAGAMAQALRLADEKARSFDCATPPETAGAFKAW